MNRLAVRETFDEMNKNLAAENDDIDAKVQEISDRLNKKQVTEGDEYEREPVVCDLEMNFASSSLFQSDQLEVVLHWLLAPVDTVMKLVELEFGHPPDRSLESPSSSLQQDRGRARA